MEEEKTRLKYTMSYYYYAANYFYMIVGAQNITAWFQAPHVKYTVYLILRLKSSGAKRVMRQNKKIQFLLVFCMQCTSPMLCKNIFPQNEL